MTTMRALRSVLAVPFVALALSPALPAAAAEKKTAPAAPSVSAQQVERIAAVVNDEVVSVSDVNARLQLTLVGTNMTDSAEARQRLLPQVLRQMVDERLQLQEAKRLNIIVSQDEIDKALGRVAEQNRMSRADLEKLLASRGIPMSTMTTQVRASLLWAKVVQRRLRSSVQVGEEEVDAVLDRIKANIGKPEFLVAEIFLAVDSPQQEDEVRRLAERLIEQIGQGAPFPAVARQFSQAAGAANGGDLGWVQAGQLPDELDNTLQQMRPGQVSKPVRDASGYHILAVRAQRTVGAPASTVTAPEPQQQAAAAPQPAPYDPKVKVTLKQLVIPVDGKVEKAKARALEILRTVKGCDAMDALIKKQGGMSGDLGTVRVGDMPEQIGRMVSVLPIGQPSPPFGNAQEMHILMVCERTGGKPQPAAAPAPAPVPVAPPQPKVTAETAKLPPREDIQQALMMERLDMLARRYLRDLRRSAFIETRM